MDNTMSFGLFVIIGMAGMFMVMLAGGRSYGFSVGKITAVCVFLTLIGVLGVYIMAFIESGSWGGRSFYGAVFLVPVLMYPVTRFLRMPYGQVLDICAPAGCVMLALLKVKCTIDGCCGGRFVSAGGRTFVFPSQKVECAVALLMAAVLLAVVISKKLQSWIYPLFMISYGAVRFVLNHFRMTVPWILGMPSGSFWSVISAAAGILAMILMRKRSSR